MSADCCFCPLKHATFLSWWSFSPCHVPADLLRCAAQALISLITSQSELPDIWLEIEVIKPTAEAKSDSSEMAHVGRVAATSGGEVSPNVQSISLVRYQCFLFFTWNWRTRKKLKEPGWGDEISHIVSMKLSKRLGRSWSLWWTKQWNSSCREGIVQPRRGGRQSWDPLPMPAETKMFSAFVQTKET